MYIISACLLGENCKYNGGNNYNDKVARFADENKDKIILICPETLGGLPVPRERAEIFNGTGEDIINGCDKTAVLSELNEDWTKAFLKGAEEVLGKAREFGATKAILKANSPSCGCGTIYDGSFSGKKKAGDGVTAALLKKHGIEVVTEEDLQSNVIINY